MPHLTLEYSNNVLENDFSSLFLQIHELLSTQLPTQLKSCKSRVIGSEDYVIGDGNKTNAFVHLSILVLKGRSVQLKSAIATTLMGKLKEHFSGSANQLDLQISIAINDLPEVYQK